MHRLKLPAFVAIVALASPMALAHPAKAHHGHARPAAMTCADMHHDMMTGGGHRSAKAGGAGMMGGANGKDDMKCMGGNSDKAAAPAKPKAAAPQHDHDHAGAQPPK